MLSGLEQWAASLNTGSMFIPVATVANLKSTDRLMKAAGRNAWEGRM